MNRDVYLSDNLFNHHKKDDEIIAIVAHEISHAKHYDVYCGAVVDTCYMLIYAIGLSLFMKHGDPVVASFGFTYSSHFISLYLF